MWVQHTYRPTSDNVDFSVGNFVLRIYGSKTRVLCIASTDNNMPVPWGQPCQRYNVKVGCGCQLSARCGMLCAGCAAGCRSLPELSLLGLLCSSLELAMRMTVPDAWTALLKTVRQ